MQRWILRLRLAGYAAGVLGAGAMYGSRALEGAAQRRTLHAGAALLLAMFVAFLASYVLHAVDALRRHGSGRGASGKGPQSS